MHHKQTIAILGATGSIGSALARLLAGGPHRLLLKSRRAEKLAGLLEEIKAAHPTADVEGMTCTRDASWEADVIIPAVPQAAQAEVAERMGEVACRKVVIDLVHSRPAGSMGPQMTALPNSAGELQALLPYARVVTVYTAACGDDASAALKHSQPATVILTGGDNEALDTVAALVRTAGFTPVISGGLISDNRSLTTA